MAPGNGTGVRSAITVRNVDYHGDCPLGPRGTITVRNADHHGDCPLEFFSHKERKERKEGMFLLLIHAVISARQFTQLVKSKNRRQV